MIIRPAVASDVASGAACHVACVREAYATLIEPERLVALTADLQAREELWRRMISEGRPLLVAVEDDLVVGFIAAGPDEPVGDATFQLWVMNLRRAHWGTGLAQQLFDAAVGDRGAYLWVLRDNARARGFYTRNGFVPDGAERFEPDFGAPIIRMVRSAASGRLRNRSETT